MRAISTGPSHAAQFEVTNTASLASAVSATGTGTGATISGASFGTGWAGLFQSAGTGSGTLPTLEARARANSAVYGHNTGSGTTGVFTHAGPTGSAGRFMNTSTVLQPYPDPALDVSSYSGPAALFRRGPSAPDPVGGYAVSVQNGNQGGGGGSFSAAGTAVRAAGDTTGIDASASWSLGWAGVFGGSGNGVQIAVSAGHAGLSVTGGTKNAVVATTTGARALYTEESSEVWFTDYGFARLQHGRVRVLLDPTFAQTVSAQVPYHVFLEPYANAELYVAERTPLGFVVQLRAGDPTAEFSYRVVARRRGYETTRLEPAPWADRSVGSGDP